MKRKALSMLLCLTVMFTMCFAFGGTAYAAQEPQTRQAMEVNAGTAPSTITPTTYASYKKDVNSLKVYTTPVVNGESKDFTYTIKMPSKGLLFIQYKTLTGNFYIKDYSVSTAGSEDLGDETLQMFYVPQAGNVTIKVCAYNFEGNAQGAFAAFYAPGSKKLSSASSTFYLGSGGYDKTSTFTVKAKSTGYLKIKVTDLASSYSSVSLKTKGFKGWDSLNSYNDYYTYVGVKKGQSYTFSLKYGKLYKVETKFTKVKETSSKTSKKKAAKIKKKATNKGVIPVNKTSKKHWYKINNPKTQKMTLIVNAKKMGDGGSYGSLKVTVYRGSDSTSYYVEPGTTDKRDITYGTYGTTKAKKGTYYVKIESDEGANGYYTFKWK